MGNLTFEFEWEKEGTYDLSGLTRNEIFEIANSANTLYKSIFIQKSAKKRQLFIPESNLEIIQRLVLRYYLKEEDVHPKVFSYISGSSLLKHIEQHKNYQFTLKIDLLNFFESINDKIVYKYFSQKHSLDLAEFLMKVTCRNGVLPIGAPTSPMLSNLVLKQLDDYWDLYGKCFHAEYTRYSDDIYISSDNKEFLECLIQEFKDYLEKFFPFLNINTQKTKLLTSNNRKITGLVITQDGSITIGRIRKRELRVLFDKYCKGHLNKKQIGSLRGKLLFLQGHDEAYFIKLQSKYRNEIPKIYSFHPDNLIEDTTVENSSLPDFDSLKKNEPILTAKKSNPLNLSQQTIKDYLDLGWHLLPCYSIKEAVCSCGKLDCKNPGKHPCVKHGVYDATSNYKELLPWLERDCNIAVATGFASNIVVLDIDAHKGGYDSLQKLLKFIDPKMFNTLQCKTGSGGLHFYFSYPAIPLKNRNGILPGIDFRTDGGYVIMPPSNHISGGYYHWIDINKLSVNDIKPLPESLFEVLRSSY